MPITPKSAVTNKFAAAAGKIRTSLLDEDFAELVAYLNQTINYSNYVVDTGTANVYVAALSGGLTFSYTDGQSIFVKITNNNTGACTINVNGLGAISIKTKSGANPSAAALVAGGVAHLIYIGGVFQLMN